MSEYDDDDDEKYQSKNNATEDTCIEIKRCATRLDAVLVTMRHHWRSKGCLMKDGEYDDDDDGSIQWNLWGYYNILCNSSAMLTHHLLSFVY